MGSSVVINSDVSGGTPSPFNCTSSTTFTLVIPVGSYVSGTWSVAMQNSTGGMSVDYIRTPSEGSTNTVIVANHGNTSGASYGPVALSTTQRGDINAYAGSTITCTYQNGLVSESNIIVTLTLIIGTTGGGTSGGASTVLTYIQFNSITDYLACMFTATLGDGKTVGAGDSAQLIPTSSYTYGTTHVSGSSADTLLSSTDCNLAGLYNINDYIVINGNTTNYRVLMTYYNGTTSYAVVSPPLTAAVSNATHVKAYDWGFSAYARLIEQKIYSYNNYALTTTLLPNIHDLQNYAPYEKIVMVAFKNSILGLKQACYNAGIALTLPLTDINSFATYYNTGSGGPYNALVSPDFALAYFNLLGRTISPSNVYAPVITNLGTWNAATSVFTSGMRVDGTRFAGTAVLNVSLPGGGSSGTTGTVSIPVTGLNAQGVLVNDTWFANINASLLTATLSGSSVKTVQAISGGWSLPGWLTTGTLKVSGGFPTGRISTSVLNPSSPPN